MKLPSLEQAKQKLADAAKLAKAAAEGAAQKAAQRATEASAQLKNNPELMAAGKALNPLKLIDLKLLPKLSGEVIAKALMKLDQATVAVVGSAWLGAVLLVALAVFTTNQMGAVRAEADASRAAEILVPKEQKTKIDPEALKQLADRLKRRYQDLSISAADNDGTLDIQSNNPEQFSSWLSAVGYVDTLASDYRWTIVKFCAGSGCGGSMMRAQLTAERLSFQPPR